ncbi:polycystin-1-like protein 2 [Ptychodera flava]|uniref:polycystin-1-like protein 2 n=1 Tax=Ptychodera flava TaxID=63121 RepID=UPI00396A9D1E
MDVNVASVLCWMIACYSTFVISEDVEPTTPCPDGWVHDGIAQVCYFFHDQQMTQPEAKQFCASMNSNVVELPNPIKALGFNQLRPTFNAEQWIGLEREVGTDQFRWISGNLLGSDMHANWATNQPRLKTFYCVLVGYLNKWENVDCNTDSWSLLSAACEIYLDNSPPVLTNCPADREEIDDVGNNLVRVSWTLPTATDDNTDDVAVRCQPSSGTNFTVGETVVTCSAMDNSGNEGSCSFKITVTQDNTPPLLSNCPEDREDIGEFTGDYVQVFWTMPTASDDYSGDVPVKCRPSPGSYISVGSNQITCDAVDDSGNQASCSFRIKVTRVCPKQPPNGGYCHVTTSIGSSLLEEFLVSCYDWKDEGDVTAQCLESRKDANNNAVGLTYELRIRDTTSDEVGRLVYTSNESSFPKLLLPAGKQETNFTVELLLNVVDIYGQNSTYSINRKINGPATASKSTQSLAEFLISLMKEIKTVDVTSEDYRKACNTLYVIADILNSLTQDQTSSVLELIQEARSLLMDTLRLLFDNTVCGSSCIEQTAQTTRSVSSFKFPDELLPETQVTGAVIIDNLVRSFTSENGNLSSVQTIKVTTDLFKSSTNIIGANHLASEQSYSNGCSESDSRLMSLLTTAINKSLDQGVSALEAPAEGSVGLDFTSQLIQANIGKYGEGATGGFDLRSKAGGFYIPPSRSNGTWLNISSKFIGSLVNQRKCHSPEKLMSSPVVNLEIIDEDGQQVQASNVYTINITKAYKDSNHMARLRVVTGDTIEFTINLTDTFQVLRMSIDSNVSDVRYDVYQRANIKPNNTHYDHNWTVSGVPPHTLTVNARSHEQSHHFQIDIGGYTGSKVSSHHMTLALSYISCLYWNEMNKKWQTDGCSPDLHLTTDNYVICQCNHLTSFTAADFVVPVNEIDFGGVFRADIKDNTVVLGTVITLFILYIVVVILMRKKDKQDLEKWISAPQIYNTCNEKFLYRITVYTGLRPGSGTSGTVAVVMFGENGRSRTIQLVDEKKLLCLKFGSVCSFLVSTIDHLGSLIKMEVELRMSERRKDDSWFLDRIEVVDILTNKRFDFVYYGWITRTMNDGKICCRTLSVSDETQMTRFVHLLSSNIRVQVFDEYLWGSVVTRQTPSHFTRVQRLSCCVAMLCLVMISNAMFYDTKDSVQATKTVDLGFHSLSLGSIYVALISSLIVVPVSVTMVTLFKKAREVVQVSPSNECSAVKKKTEKKVDNWNINKFGCFRLIAWLLVFVSSFLSTFFVVLYSLEWGPDRSKQWLIIELTSFFFSVCVVDPSKAIILALLFSIFFKLRKKPFKAESDDAYRQGSSSSTGKKGTF